MWYYLCQFMSKAKLRQVEVNSNIAQNHFHSSQEVLSAHYLHKFVYDNRHNSGDTSH